MKKFILISAVLITVIAISCGNTPSAPETPAPQPVPSVSNFSEAYGKNWKLVEVRVNNRNIDFDRNTLTKEGFGEIFTIRIDASNISGVGAPNQYSAPYTVSAEDPSFVTIAMVRSTLMAAINNPEKLREHDFFAYIQNTFRWGLREGKLELRSKNNDGEDVVMLFSL